LDEPIVHKIETLSLADAQREMERIGVHPDGVRIMAPKAVFSVLKIYRLSPYHANVLKQEMLSIGAEAATAAGCIDCSRAESDVILMGTLSHYRKLFEKLKQQPPSFHPLAQKILEAAQTPSPSFNLNWNFGNRKISFNQRRILIMGILNVTPDSFSDGGQFFKTKDAVAQALKMEEAGADILDIGGESSRPGSQPVSDDEEMVRVLPVLQELLGKTAFPISIDTYKADLAEAAISMGAAIVNDITALRRDPRMASLCAERKLGVVLMHMKGEPKSMQDAPHYEDVVAEVSDFFEERINAAIAAGIQRDAIVLDPGTGIAFGKNLEHNIALMRAIPHFIERHQRPIMLGVSRKRFIGELTGKNVRDRLGGTIAAAAFCALKGASILRVHDVAECRDAIKVVQALNDL